MYLFLSLRYNVHVELTSKTKDDHRMAMYDRKATRPKDTRRQVSKKQVTSSKKAPGIPVAYWKFE